MFMVILLGAAMVLGFGAVGVLGITVVYVLQRWYYMLKLQIDWDDAGVLIAARARKRWGHHLIFTGHEPSPVMRRADKVLGRPRPRVIRPVPVSASAEQPVQHAQVSGRPPWGPADTPTTLIRRPAQLDPDATMIVRRIEDERHGG